MLPFALIAAAALLWSRRASVSAPAPTPLTPGPAPVLASLKSQPKPQSGSVPAPVLLKPNFVPDPASPPLNKVNGTGMGVLGVPFCQSTRVGRIASCRAQDKQCYIFHTRIAPIVSLGNCNPGGSNFLDISNNFR